MARVARCHAGCLCAVAQFPCSFLLSAVSTAEDCIIFFDAMPHHTTAAVITQRGSAWIAHSKLSKVCALPFIVTWKALSYSLPQVSHLAIGHLDKHHNGSTLVAGHSSKFVLAEIWPSSSFPGRNALHRANRQPAFVPLDDSCEARIVLEQALAAEAQEIISEMRILEA